MADNWFNFISSIHGTFNSEQEISFSSSPPLVSGDCLLTDLSWLGIIEVSGEDKQTFLQGQLTNDINSVKQNTSQLSGLCTPKGRLRALFRIFSAHDKLYLQLPKPLLEETLKRLKMFVMMSQVELSNVSDSLIRIGLYGTQAEHCLQQYGLTLPDEVDAVSESKDIQIIRLAGEQARFECLGEDHKIQALWQALQDHAQLINTSQWRLLDIQAGIPNVFSPSKEAFIPQMLNLQALDAINFKKGCYTGQEVVARMQYLGKLKRRMYRMHCQRQELPLPNTPLYSESSKSAQGAGHVVDAQYSPDGGIELLAVVSNDAVANNDIYLDEAQQHPLSTLALPYSLTIEQ